MSSASTVGLGYYWGDDGYGLEQAATKLGAKIGAASGSPLDAWRVRGDQTTSAVIAERVATAPMFGGGSLVVVSDPLPLARSKEDRDVLLAVLRSVAPGNALVFLEPVDGSERRAKTLDAVRDAIAAEGGEVRELKAPREGNMARWIEERARERGMRLAPGAAQELATRIGAFVREGDVDRRRQGHLAVGELEKLRLLRPDAPVSVDDVQALVPEAVPGSTWAFLDAVAARRLPLALELLERLLPVTPEQVLIAVLHRRLRELIQVGDLMAAGANRALIMKLVGLKPYPAEKLEKQVPAWTMPELEAALEGLLQLDATLKGRDRPIEEAQRRLAITLWVAEHVRPRVATSSTDRGDRRR